MSIERQVRKKQLLDCEAHLFAYDRRLQIARRSTRPGRWAECDPRHINISNTKNPKIATNKIPEFWAAARGLWGEAKDARIAWADDARDVEEIVR